VYEPAKVADLIEGKRADRGALSFSSFHGATVSGFFFVVFPGPTIPRFLLVIPARVSSPLSCTAYPLHDALGRSKD
jgi:hypothetical protein